MQKKTQKFGLQTDHLNLLKNTCKRVECVIKFCFIWWQIVLKLNSSPETDL